MIDIPKIKIGIVAVSRDWFTESLLVNRRKEHWLGLIKQNIPCQKFMNVQSELL